jgi:serpin B
MNTKRNMHILMILILVISFSQFPLFSNYHVIDTLENSKEVASYTINHLSFNVFRELSIQNKTENIVFCPFSLAVATTMAYSGADGNTKCEFEKAFAITDKNLFLGSFKNLLQQYADSSVKKAFISNNSIWIEAHYPVLPEYILSLKSNFQTESKRINVKNNMEIEKSVREVNYFIENHTGKLIKNMLGNDALNSNTRLLLINTSLFRSQWLYTFNPEDTREDTFYCQELKPKLTDFMNNSKNVPYFEDSGYKAISLPYTDRNFSMIIILPATTSSLDSIEMTISPEWFAALVRNFRKHVTELCIPKFKIECSYEMKDVLRKTGVHEAFDENADFSGISGNKELFLSSIMHKTIVEANEKETKAASSTVVVMALKSAYFEEEKKYFKANKPFIFMIYNNNTKTILFQGRLSKP